MSDFFNRRTYLLHEHIGLTNLHEEYEIYDAESSSHLGSALECATVSQKIGKLFLDRALMGLQVEVRERSGKTLLKLNRDGCGLFHDITVTDHEGKLVCRMVPATIGLGAHIEVQDAVGTRLGQICGGWRGESYTFTGISGELIGKIDHLWRGCATEMFTTADDYRIEVKGGAARAPMVLAGALCIDLLYHEA